VGHADPLPEDGRAAFKTSDYEGAAMIYKLMTGVHDMDKRSYFEQQVQRCTEEGWTIHTADLANGWYLLQREGPRVNPPVIPPGPEA